MDTGGGGVSMNRVNAGTFKELWATEQKLSKLKFWGFFFGPIVGINVFREVRRAKLEKVTVKKGIAILEAERAKYLNITKTDDDKNQTKTDNDDDDDDEDGDSGDRKEPTGGNGGGGNDSSSGGGGPDYEYGKANEDDIERLKKLFDKKD
jgi:hypothetical protein